MSNQIFISYAREDQEFAVKLAKILRDRGVSVWLDQWAIPPGADWDRSIDNAITECAKILVVLSPKAVDSHQVKSEWSAALKKRKPIFPILFQACQVPRQLELFQYVDITTHSLEDEDTLEPLIHALRGSASVQPALQKQNPDGTERSGQKKAVQKEADLKLQELKIRETVREYRRVQRTVNEIPGELVTSLKAEFEARKPLLQQLSSAFNTLTAIANDLLEADKVVALNNVYKRMQASTLTLTIAGRFKNGKSTLLNALLGPLLYPLLELGSDRRGPMPTDELPCTATVTRVCYASRPFVRAWGFDGKAKEWSLEQYLKESMLHGSQRKNQEIFGNICEFELGLPAELCQLGVTLIDSPGIDEHTQREEITHRAIKQSDAVIMVYRSSPFAGVAELQFTSKVLARSTPVFSVVNLMNGREVNERLKQYVWERLVEDNRGRPTYDGQDFLSQDIYFIDVLKAQEGRLKNNQQLVTESGLALFEQQLAKFLNNQRLLRIAEDLAHAENLASDIERTIEKGAGLDRLNLTAPNDISRMARTQRFAIQKAKMQLES